MNWTEAVAVVFGAAAVALTIRQSLWCWPLGLVQVALYVYVFYQARLYSDMVLHVIYVVLQVYGWYRWRRGERGSALPVSYLSLTERAGWAMAIALAASVWGEAMLRYTDAAAPRADAFIAAASLAAQYLLAIKKLENWIVWIVVDVVAIAVVLGPGPATDVGPLRRVPRPVCARPHRMAQSLRTRAVRRSRRGCAGMTPL